MSSTNHRIALSTAIAMTRRYRANRPANFPICETFESGVISALLSETGCQYLRIYYGMDEDNAVHAILVGADVQNADLLPAGDADTESDTGVNPQILEDGYRCPHTCPPTSQLNG